MFLTHRLAFPLCLMFCFSSDLITAELIGWPMMQSVLALYLVQVLSCATEIRLILTGLTVMLESFIAHGAFFIPLIYLIPVLLLGIYARHILYPGILQRLCIATLVLIMQSVLVECYFLDLMCPFGYILYRLCANLVVILFL